jgi:hypothetical protein
MGSRRLVVVAVLMLAVGRVWAQTEPPQVLMKEVIYNELQDRERESNWEYRLERKTPAGTLIAVQIETQRGPVYRAVATERGPLDAGEQQQEAARLNELMGNPGEQDKVRQQYQHDEQHVESMMALMPEAFLCDYAGTMGDTVKLTFRPNPSFSPPTFEARVFHGLAGTLLVSLAQKRLMEVKGSLIERVDFGFGLLGHVEKDGTFAIHREPVSSTHWKTSLVDVHIQGKVILFKTVSKDQHEVRSGFKAVPVDLSLQQARNLLDEVAGAAAQSLLQMARH